MNYGQFLRLLKRYCINRNIKNENLVNDPIEGIVKYANIKKTKGSEKGFPLYYEATESSKIINNKLDISPKIKDAMRYEGILEIVAESFDSFYEDNIDKNMIGDLIDEYLNIIENDSCFGKKEISLIKSFSNDPCRFLSMIMIKSLREQNKSIDNDDFIIWENGNRYIKIIAGDIFNYAFGRKSGKQRIVIIPVNTSFDVHITSNLEKESLPAVSLNSLHGQFLLRVYKSNISESELKNRIRQNLIINGYINEEDDYIDLPIGALATLSFGRSFIYLLAVSKFDNNGIAHSSKENIREAITKLLNYYDSKGLGYDIYIPLMGTGLSRAQLDYQDSFNLIVRTLLKNKNKLQGRFNIVLQPEVLAKITIDKETLL